MQPFGVEHLPLRMRKEEGGRYVFYLDTAAFNAALLQGIRKMNTNDPQQPKADPMFDRYFAYSDGHIEKDEAGDWVKWNDLQAKITSGELMVVKKTFPHLDYKEVGPTFICSECDENLCPYGIGDHRNKFLFCPGCGSKIIET